MHSFWKMAEWILSDTYLHFTLLWRDFCRRNFGQEGFWSGGILVRRDFDWREKGILSLIGLKKTNMYASM